MRYTLLILIALPALRNTGTAQSPADAVQLWLTSGDKSKLLSREADLPFDKTAATGIPVIDVDTNRVFQTVEGYGAALTGSSAYLLHRKMDGETRRAALKKLFDPTEGIGISYLRLTLGASDFSLSDFTYDDLPAGQTDFDLRQFSLAQDRDDVIPVLKAIMALAPGIRLMATPWSPPAWMKTNRSLQGGKLKPDCYGVYGDYFVRYIREMRDEGIRIDAVTPQNEPLHFTAGYLCMEMQPAEQADFIKNHLGPKLESAGLDTKIIVYDHNWDRPDYPLAILDDPEAKKYVAGSAFHAYGGDVSAMSAVHNAHPDKGLYFTEISGGAWATNFSDNLMWNMQHIFIGTALNWSKTALFWNLVLDPDHGPTNKGCADCRGVVTLDPATGQIAGNEEFYALGHFSKFVRPNAVRIAALLPQTLRDVGAVAFRNADGSKAMVVCNYGTADVVFGVRQGKKTFNCSVPGRSVATLVW